MALLQLRRYPPQRGRSSRATCRARPTPRRPADRAGWPRRIFPLPRRPAAGSRSRRRGRRRRRTSGGCVSAFSYSANRVLARQPDSLQLRETKKRVEQVGLHFQGRLVFLFSGRAALLRLERLCLELVHARGLWRHFGQAQQLLLGQTGADDAHVIQHVLVARRDPERAAQAAGTRHRSRHSGCAHARSARERGHRSAAAQERPCPAPAHGPHHQPTAREWPRRGACRWRLRRRRLSVRHERRSRRRRSPRWHCAIGSTLLADNASILDRHVPDQSHNCSHPQSAIVQVRQGSTSMIRRNSCA